MLLSSKKLKLVSRVPTKDKLKILEHMQIKLKYEYFNIFFYLNVALTETKRNRVWMQIVPLNLSLRIYNSFGSQIRPKFEPTIKLRLGSFPVKCNVTKFKPTITQTGSPTSVELLPQNPIQSPLQLLGLSMHRPTKVNKEVMFV